MGDRSRGREALSSIQSRGRRRRGEEKPPAARVRPCIDQIRIVACALAKPCLPHSPRRPNRDTTYTARTRSSSPSEIDGPTARARTLPRGSRARTGLVVGKNARQAVSQFSTAHCDYDECVSIVVQPEKKNSVLVFRKK